MSSEQYLDYQIGVFKASENPLTLRDLREAHRQALEVAAREQLLKSSALKASALAQAPAVAQWLSLEESFKHPLELTDAAARGLALRNLEVEIRQGDRRQYVVDAFIMKPSEARQAIMNNDKIADSIINIIQYISYSVLEADEMRFLLPQRRPLGEAR